MKKLNYLTVALAFTVAGYCAHAQDKTTKTGGAEKPKMDAKSQEEAMMKSWMSYMTPGPAHEMMAKSNGEWNQEVTMWMAPGAPPQKSTATCTNTMIMGGRYQQSTSKGDFNGMPFEGMSTTGYDNATHTYQSTWIDNMGTGIMFTQGKYNDQTKTLTMRGKMVDPMTSKEKAIRETLKFADDNTQFMEMFEMRDGKEFKTMEIKFTRK